MTLPAFQVRGRMGEVLNLSTVDDRSEISKAELYHVIDVAEGCWCRPCQSTGCDHAAQVERILAAAGLSSRQTGEYHDLPGITDITRYVATGECVGTCWFDNGARLRFHEQRDGTVMQSVFGPDSPLKPVSTIERERVDTAPAGLLETLATYCRYRQLGDRDGLTDRHPELVHLTDSPTDDPPK